MMTTEKLYNTTRDCCGCEACVQICPQHIIKMEADKEGFFYPRIKDNSSCINCGLCIKVCPLKTKTFVSSEILANYGGYNKDETLIKASSSGAFAYTISAQIIKNGGIVYGVQYTGENLCDISYIRCIKIEDLKLTRGSKYSQARKYNIFKFVKDDLINGKTVLFIGLPCEVAGLYHFLGKDFDNLYSIDLICHGPTSLGVHASYIRYLLQNKKKNSLKKFSVRYKLSAWKPYYIHAVFDDNSEYLKRFVETEYGIAFQQLKRPSCYSCKFKISDKAFGMPADITIGDYHLAHEGMIEYNRWGSSQVSIHTEKGIKLVNLVKDEMALNTISNDSALTYNAAFIRPNSPKWNRQIFVRILMNQGLYAACNHWTVKLTNTVTYLKRTFLTLAVKLRKQLFGKIWKA